MTERFPPQIQVALVQMSCCSDPQTNIETALKRIATAVSEGADVVCLQELFASEYPCQSENHQQFDLAEPLPGPTYARISAAAKSNQVVVIGSFFEQRAPGIYHNTAVVFDTDGREAGRYRKMHIPDDPFYYEKFYFTPGDLGFRTISTSKGPLGVCICWDQWFPEAARLTALSGAQILFYPTAIGWLPTEKEQWGATQCSAWETMMRSHAIANGVFVAAANRIGQEGELEFWGQSFICDPNGNVIARAADDQEQILHAECNLAQVGAVRTHWPFLRDRRIDAYQGLEKRYLEDDDC
ncbi:MAG: carbon-nitrogen hydrolase [Planctomycetaceae bacterium]|nr:carbon-nitrogen hydrolase [Planctomycetaceae bacterium]